MVLSIARTYEVSPITFLPCDLGLHLHNHGSP